MGINEQELEISQRDEPQLQGRAYGLTTVGGVQFPEQVVEVRLDGRHPKAELLGQPFGWQSLCYATEDLHLPGRQSDSLC